MGGDCFGWHDGILMPNQAPSRPKPALKTPLYSSLHQHDQCLRLHDAHVLIHLGNWLGAGSGFLILINADVLNHTYLLLWFGAFTLYTCVSLVYRMRVKRDHLAQLSIQHRWLFVSTLSMATLGLLWSTMFIPVMLSAQTAYQFAVLAGGAMLSAGAMASVSAHPPSYRAVFLTIFTPIVVILFFQQSWLTLGMGIAGFLFLFYMLWSGNLFHTNYLRSLRLRDENLALIDELRVQKEAAEQAALAKSRFLAAASHDLRQPMHALNMYHNILANSALDDKAMALLVNAQQCAAAMDEMFSVLLDISKLDAGVVQPSEYSFPVAKMLDRVRIEFTPMATEKGLRLRVIHSSALIHTDPGLAGRILHNLLTNAVRYTTSGRITVGCRVRGDSVRMLVADTGVGIATDQLSIIFEEYVQLGNPERDRSKGLGLGLAIVQRLAQLLKASIGVESTLGKGSVFWVEFPRAKTVELNTQSVLPAQGGLQGIWVIVVDDEQAIREATQELLHHWGCKVTLAGSGDEAVKLTALSTERPHLILCDYRLRNHEYGLEAIEKLRTEFCADIPAILITGDTAPEHIAEIKSNDIPVLHKPLRPETLRQALLALI